MHNKTKLLMSVSASVLTVFISSTAISQTYFSFGNATYGSDGYSSHTYGNMTYGSDGTTCITVGNTSFCN